MKKEDRSYTIGRRIRQRRETPRDKTDRSRGRLDSKTAIRLRIYEMGGLPRLQILVRLAGALEVAIDRILIGSKK